MNYYIFFLLLFLSANKAVSQNSNYEWEEGLSKYIGVLDTNRFNKQDIQRIHDYLYSRHSDMLTLGNIWKIEQMDTASTDAIDNYYIQTLHVLETMKIPAGSYWDSLLLYRKKELKEVYEHTRIMIIAINNPQILKTVYRKECVQEFLALTGDSTTLMSAWRTLINQQKSHNGYPEFVEAEYQEKLHSVNCLKYARLDVLTYGWGNCMNQFISYYDEYKRLEKEFQKLFITVQIVEEED